MDATFLSVHLVTGLIGLPQEAPFDLLEGEGAGRRRAVLTMDREEPYLHLKRCAAYGVVIAGTLAATRVVEPWTNRFSKALATMRIDDGVRIDSPLLLIEVTGAAGELATRQTNDFGDCAFGMRMFDQTKIAGEAARLLEDAVTGIMLTLTASSTPTVAAIGNVAYATEPGSGRLIYSLEPSASASMTSSTSYEASALADASRMTRSITRQDELRTVVRLLARSVQTTDNMQAFLTAWAALEVFLHKTFRDTYEQTIFAKLADRAAPSEQAFVKRLRDVMAGKYNIKDKFVVVASGLTSADADADIALFKKLKEERDGIHTMSLRLNGYSAAATQDMVRKYLRLHLLAWD